MFTKFVSTTVWFILYVGFSSGKFSTKVCVTEKLDCLIEVIKFLDANGVGIILRYKIWRDIYKMQNITIPFCIL